MNKPQKEILRFLGETVFENGEWVCEGANVLTVELLENNTLVELAEACDGYYGKTLTKKEFGILITELIEIRDKMKTVEADE